MGGGILYPLSISAPITYRDIKTTKLQVGNKILSRSGQTVMTVLFSNVHCYLRIHIKKFRSLSYTQEKNVILKILELSYFFVPPIRLWPCVYKSQIIIGQLCLWDRKVNCFFFVILKHWSGLYIICSHGAQKKEE